MAQEWKPVGSGQPWAEEWKPVGSGNPRAEEWKPVGSGEPSIEERKPMDSGHPAAAPMNVESQNPAVPQAPSHQLLQTPSHQLPPGSWTSHQLPQAPSHQLPPGSWTSHQLPQAPGPQLPPGSWTPGHQLPPGSWTSHQLPPGSWTPSHQLPPGSWTSHQLPPGPWTTGLCDCFDDCEICCITYWCPCITFGRIAEIVDRGSTSCGASALLYFIIQYFTGCACLLSCAKRGMLRSQYGLDDAPCCDCCVHFWCESCALCQEYRELKNRGFDMSLGWRGHLEKQARGATTTPPHMSSGMSR